MTTFDTTDFTVTADQLLADLESRGAQVRIDQPDAYRTRVRIALNGYRVSTASTAGRDNAIRTGYRKFLNLITEDEVAQ
jgi:hypothetical protein